MIVETSTNFFIVLSRTAAVDKMMVITRIVSMYRSRF